MKNVLLSGLLVFAFIAYAVHLQNDHESTAPVVAPAISNNSAPSPVDQTSGSQNAPQPTPATIPASSQYKDGRYTGNIADAYYGNVQIQTTISGGKITDVEFLDYPHDRGTSIEINSQAMPYLKQEAIQAQNANVDIISGATQTSLAFRESFQSALDKAR